eukprot:TRINITY_DN74041_c0_g1_i1.p1 TRINITY_DN74041_c0_g1~~TRINITY_DN74041_c0_g1_i1.p1  ORF type:complete len:402 (+),score=96.15 TRINITY_DN74041_c0_g1_i1:46-1206(+)
MFEGFESSPQPPSVLTFVGADDLEGKSGDAVADAEIKSGNREKAFDEILQDGNATMCNLIENNAADEADKIWKATTDAAAASVPQEDAAPPTPRETQLQDAIDAEHVDLASAIGGVFNSLHKKGTTGFGVYGKFKTHAEKSQFRLQWAKVEYEEFQKKNIFQQTWHKVDTSRGEYVSFSKVSEGEGPTDSDRVAAVRHCMECCKLGPVMRKSFREDMASSWALLQEDMTKTRATPRQLADDAKSSSYVSTGGGSPDGKDDATRDDRKRKRDTSRGVGNEKREKTQAHSALSAVQTKAFKIKTIYHNVTSSAASLLNTIRIELSWAWANSATVLDDLTRSQRELSQLTEFQQNFLVRDIKEMKMEMTTELLVVELNKFVELGRRSQH